MKNQDPIDALTNYYQTNIPTAQDDGMLDKVLDAKRGKKQKRLAAVGGFSAALTVAALLLAWAAFPTKNNKDSASAIARYQMINSGLVEATNEKVQTR